MIDILQQKPAVGDRGAIAQRLPETVCREGEALAAAHRSVTQYNLNHSIPTDLFNDIC
jgi:hypothetical protein